VPAASMSCRDQAVALMNDAKLASDANAKVLRATLRLLCRAVEVGTLAADRTWPGCRSTP